MLSCGALKTALRLLIFSASLLFLPDLEVLRAHAETVSSADPVAPQPSSSPSPVCIDDPATLENIRELQRANRRSPHKYRGYRQALSRHAIAPEEALARLIYAETLASHCTEHFDLLQEMIAATLINRIRRRSGQILDVVFERDQFASSLNIYSESQYREFLCPKNSALWREVLATTRRLRSQSELPLPPDAVNYYFYQHASRFTPPDWTRSLKEVQGAKNEAFSDEFRECVRFFRNPGWALNLSS